jgi:type I restriction enzyme R subunit
LEKCKNQDIAADISYIRTLALDTVLVSHEDRIKMQLSEIKAMKSYMHQLKWIDAFENNCCMKISSIKFIKQTFRRRRYSSIQKNI